MANDVPTGDRAVFAFFEMVALAFAFEGVAAVLNGKPWSVMAGSWVACVIFFTVGLKWSLLKKRLGISLASKLKRIITNPLYSLVAGAVAGIFLYVGLMSIVGPVAAVWPVAAPNPPVARSEGGRLAASPGPYERIFPSKNLCTVIMEDPNGLPVSGAQVLLVSANGTHGPVEITDSTGMAYLPKPTSDSVDLYCAHSDFAAYYKNRCSTAATLRIRLRREAGVGSLLRAGIGYVDLPGLDGAWDPRTYPSGYTNAGEHYAYVQNLSVNGHVESLVPFKPGREVILEDSKGHRIDLALIAANAECFLMEYRKH